MAKKKHKADDQKRKQQPKRQPRRPADLPDPQVMEGVMRQFVADDTPLGKAQALVYQAFKEPDVERRVQLAQDALAQCPDCADAYNLLAEHAPSRKQALELYRQGVAAGERALGPEAFQQAVGHFWGIQETRPYMRARLGLAHALWTTGRRDEAVEHLQDLLRLNPNDNQGVRYTLAGFLLFLDRDADLARLLEQYPDEESAAWAYTRALLAFRQQGDTIETRRLLKAAKKANKYVPDYLLGKKFPPAHEPTHYRPGHESEAVNYIGSFMAGWKATPGAISWLRSNTKAVRVVEPQPKGPLAATKKAIKDRLPQRADLWQADFRQFPNWIETDGGPVRPWAVLVTSQTEDLVLAHQMPEGEPSVELLWDTLAQAMRHPAMGEPHRPTEVQVRADERWTALQPHLEEVGVKLAVTDELEQLEEVFDLIYEQVCGRPQPGLLDAGGVTPEQVKSFYEAAAAFFQQAPWKKVGYESAIRVECPKFKGGPWFAVLMGQSGLTSGLALYDNLKTLQRLWAGDDDEEESALETVGTTVTFGEEWDIPVADLEAGKEYGWPVARSDAYPSLFHKERGLSIRPPLGWEMALMEGCLRAVPDFVSRHPQDSPAREEFTVPTAEGPLKLTLSWVPEEETL